MRAHCTEMQLLTEWPRSTHLSLDSKLNITISITSILIIVITSTDRISKVDMFLSRPENGRTWLMNPQPWWQCSHPCYRNHFQCLMFMITIIVMQIWPFASSTWAGGSLALISALVLLLHLGKSVLHFGTHKFLLLQKYILQNLVSDFNIKPPCVFAASTLSFLESGSCRNAGEFVLI